MIPHRNEQQEAGGARAARLLRPEFAWGTIKEIKALQQKLRIGAERRAEKKKKQGGQDENKRTANAKDQGPWKRKWRENQNAW